MEYQQSKKNNKNSEKDIITMKKKITSESDKPVGKKPIRTQ